MHEVAESLGYRREAVRHTTLGTAVRTDALALAVTDVTNPFFSPIIRGAERAAAEAGYVVLLTDAAEHDEAERRIIQRAVPLVDGLVVASSRLSDTDLRSLAKVVPVVVLNRVVSGLPSVVPDTGRGVRRAVEHLAELGHRHITYVAGPEGVLGRRQPVARAAGGGLRTRLARASGGSVRADRRRRAARGASRGRAG